MKRCIAVIGLSILSTLSVYAEKDYCKKIKKTYSELQGKTTYTTPMGGWGFSYSGITLNKVIDSEHTAFYVAFNITAAAGSYSQKGIYIKFSDGEILKFPDEKVSCSLISLNQYLMIGILDITPQNIELFKAKRIVKFGLGEFQGEYDQTQGELMRIWFGCMEKLD